MITLYAQKYGLKCVASVLLVIGITLGSSGMYMVLKAQLAQVLLDSAWQQSIEQGERIKPWSWADTYPVGKINVAKHDEELVVLYGTSGRVLAFGPGLQSGSALPNQVGNTVIAAHRDTHFSFLKDVEINDVLEVQDSSGHIQQYRVGNIAIADEDEAQWMEEKNALMLTMITCYPFNEISERSKQRYIVQAFSI